MTLEQQLKQLIEKAKNEEVDKVCRGERHSFCPTDFKEGANLLLPVLIKAISQRDKQLSDSYRMAGMYGEEIGEAMEDQNDQLLKLLE